MIQNIIKVLTLGFFVSMLTGFVIYRMGYFDSSTPSSALQTSPNGGELNSANQVPDSIQTPQINQQNKPEIMPSSKSITPAIDLKEYQEKKAKEQRMSSSKSTILTDFNLEVEDVKEHYVRPQKSMRTIDLKKIEKQKGEELRMASSKSLIITDFNLEAKDVIDPLVHSSKTLVHPIGLKTSSNAVSAREEPTGEVEKPAIIYWGMIGLGVLGILFVGIGSIVYFKKKSK